MGAHGVGIKRLVMVIPLTGGAHMFDIAQAAIGMDGSGPVEFTPKGDTIGTQYFKPCANAKWYRND